MYIAILVLLLLLYIFAIHPSVKRRREAAEFCRHAFAHRGLFGSVPENTLAAFHLAREAEVGIELDVRLTKDKQVVVFHDDTLQRAAGAKSKIEDLTYQELQTIPLFGSEETVPLLSDALKEAGGVPLLVEIKAAFDCAELCKKTADLLAGYAGEVAIESFSPIAVRWFAKNRPEFLRGQLSSRFKFEGRELPLWQRFVIANLLTNFFAKPDFVAYDIRHKNQVSFLLCRKIFRVPVLYWTVCGKQDGAIFEEKEL